MGVLNLFEKRKEYESIIEKIECSGLASMAC